MSKEEKKRRKLRIMGPKESIKDLGKRWDRLKKGTIGKTVSKTAEGVKKAGKWAKTRTFTGETSLFSRKQFGGGKKKTTKSKTVKGRKLSPYEARQAERKAAMQDRARARHKAWKEERARKKEARKNRK